MSLVFGFNNGKMTTAQDYADAGLTVESSYRITSAEDGSVTVTDTTPKVPEREVEEDIDL
ncbi:hypothetical protein ACGFWE_08235 [Streptomyces sp. NPDC048523]|uniref:hypothetical protein n=1 Tax=Streptomyces sp. NPDC048523 TaxID=3365567 RepID=UPI0037195217